MREKCIKVYKPFTYQKTAYFDNEAHETNIAKTCQISDPHVSDISTKIYSFRVFLISKPFLI